MIRSADLPGSRRGFLAFAAGCGLVALAGSARRRASWSRARTTRGSRIPQPVESGKKIEVLEFFSLRLPALRRARAGAAVAWLKTLPADVEFRRIPVDFQPRNGRTSARSTTRSRRSRSRRSSRRSSSRRCTARSMPLFEPKGRSSTGRRASGVDRKKVEEMFNSFAINGKMNRAKQLAKNVQHPVGADDHRRRQVPDRLRQGRARTRTCRAAIDAAGRQGAQRAEVGRPPPPDASMKVFLTGASSGLGEPRWRATTPRAAPRSAWSRAARASSRRSRPRSRLRPWPPMPPTCATRRRWRGPAPTSSRASACPTSSSPTRASRAGR